MYTIIREGLCYCCPWHGYFPMVHHCSGGWSADQHRFCWGVLSEEESFVKFDECFDWDATRLGTGRIPAGFLDVMYFIGLVCFGIFGIVLVNRRFEKPWDTWICLIAVAYYMNMIEHAWIRTMVQTYAEWLGIPSMFHIAHQASVEPPIFSMPCQGSAACCPWFAWWQMGWGGMLMAQSRAQRHGRSAEKRRGWWGTQEFQCQVSCNSWVDRWLAMGPNDSQWPRWTHCELPWYPMA